MSGPHLAGPETGLTPACTLFFHHDVWKALFTGGVLAQHLLRIETERRALLHGYEVRNPTLPELPPAVMKRMSVRIPCFDVEYGPVE